MPVRKNLLCNSLEAKIDQIVNEQVEPGQIVFYGPSNFTRWDPEWGNNRLDDDIRGASGKKCAINRGFGGSYPEQQLYYYWRMVPPCKPKIMVYAPGIGNGRAKGYTDEEQLDLAQRLVIYAQHDMPGLQVVIMGLNLNKGKYREDNKIYNDKLREFAEQTPGCRFIDPTLSVPLSRQDIYIEDGIHYTPEGYALYADWVREELKEELAQY